ncbi:MAG: BMP family ABC transporter substrate-binding protein [Proteobacteria bacterium]|nr:BMP family ABC transporter substrate-binding protein [Pseudomonadota bacterium]
MNTLWLRRFGKTLSVGLVVLFIASAGGQAALAEIKIGLVLERSGKDDKSFNASAYQGLKRAEKELGVTTKTVEAPDNSAYESLQRAFAEKKFDLIVAVGFHQLEAVKKNAARFPGQKFLLIDEDAKAPNVRSVMFEEHEGSYLIGALATLHSKTGKVGFIGGMDVPLIRRFQMGYEAGAKKVNPKVEVVSNYLGVTGEAWNNPPKAKELAFDQYNHGVDVIFVAAGNSGLGVFDAAADKGKLAIGVDSNQNWIKPGFILSSMLKRVDEAVFDSIRMYKDGKFSTGLVRMGVKSKGVDYALDENNSKLVSEVDKKQLESLRTQIISGKIKVPDYYLVQKKK